MSKLDELQKEYGSLNDLEIRPLLEQLRDGLKAITPDDVTSSEQGKLYIELIKKFREAIAKLQNLNGANYLERINSILRVGEDGLYSNSLRFIFELIQNVDDCDFLSPEDCRLDMKFDLNYNRIILTYNETGFTPFNVFAITGIAEAAKNTSSAQNQIGEKGIGFKSVFGVSDKVLIRSGWFSFELYRDNFTIPVPAYDSNEYCQGTQMTLFIAKGTGGARYIYDEIKRQYCDEESLFSKNPLLFLNKLTSLKMYFDEWRCMEFHVSRSELSDGPGMKVERDVEISVNLHGKSEKNNDVSVTKTIRCSRYSYPVVFSRKACQSRYGEQTEVGKPDGKPMTLRVILPEPEYLKDIGNGALYSFLPTQLRLTVPVVCHVPFKLDASREFVDPQGENLWFENALGYLAKLVDEAYEDWKTVVKEDIVRYLPGASEYLFDRNNGKEKCLLKESFSGTHYLKLPLFHAADGDYHRADEVFCFDQKEQVAEQEKVSRLMGFRNILFVTLSPVGKLRIKTERNIKDRLFKRALSEPSATEEILEYLDSAKYSYPDDLDQENLSFTPEQIEIFFRHTKLVSLLKDIGCKHVRDNSQQAFTVQSLQLQKDIRKVMYDGFDLSETPLLVEKYLISCGRKCVCIDIDDDDFLPCRNAVILSERNTQSSLASLCFAIDKRDTFAIRIKLREASKQLDEAVENEEGSASDYLRNLGNVRRAIKDALGHDGYRSYIDLILRSGTDKGRFIQEILQNADDCDYPEGIVPSFSLIRNGNTAVTEYNETGFSRANIRAITAIGESTKKRLFDRDLKAIGEKGVGFKTIFAVASEVRIHSGEYSFSLSDREPTIPKTINSAEEKMPVGTRMEVILRRPDSFPSYDEKTMLKLCLCLRRLRSVRLGVHTLSIEDTEVERKITIDGKNYVFRRFVHPFTVTDQTALEERRGGAREISPEQTITCFIPPKNSPISEYALYNGLPTKHLIKIPLVIDAPFALTTSREEIETDSSAWNRIVRRELYSAVTEVINALKQTEREEIFRFTRFIHTGRDSYVNDISDCAYLNESSDFISDLKSMSIVPTFDRDVFDTPARKVASRYHEVANILFRNGEYAGISPLAIIDVESHEYDTVLNALGYDSVKFDAVFDIVSEFADEFITEPKFRTALYRFLKDTPYDFLELVKQLVIIPVFGKNKGSVEYVSWYGHDIFVKPNADTSAENYYILDEKLLTKADCESIFRVNINEINGGLIDKIYNDRLKAKLCSGNLEDAYYFLMGEFKSGALEEHDSSWIIRGADTLPLKNGLGLVVNAAATPLFFCDLGNDYFQTEMIQCVVINDECAAFASRFMRLRNLSEIHYEDLHYHKMLTEDDVETLLDDYFENFAEILRRFYNDSLLSDELVIEYNLGGIVHYGSQKENSEEYEFPSETVGDREALSRHIRRQWQSPVKIVSVKVERTVQKGQNADGSVFDLAKNDARSGALRIYTPEGAKDRCFCQMCLKNKPYRLIEVNNVELQPKFYFPQLRIALCLECSKRFEDLRNNQMLREQFLEAIKEADIQDYDGTADVRIGDAVIKFTGKHLAEIQEILKQMPE